MKRIFSILLAAILLATLLLAPAASADDAKMAYKLTGGSGKIGDTVQVVVSVENAPAIISYETTLLYDPAVLKPTGTYQKMYMGGLMAFNPNFTSPVEGKGAIKVAAFGTTKAIMAGDLDLYNFTFEIIGGTADEKGTLVEIHSHSFSQNDENLSKVPALIVTPCRIGVVNLGLEDAPTDDPVTDVPSTEEPENTPDTNTGATDTTPEVDEDKKPTGDWYIDPDTNQAILVEKDEEGKDVLHQFTTEYEKDEEGKTTGVILYDEEKKEAGKLNVNQDEYGNLTVIEQEIKEPFSMWFLLPIGVAVLIAIGGVILAVKSRKK